MSQESIPIEGKTSKASPKQKVNPMPKQVMYLGPTIAERVGRVSTVFIAYGTIFKNGLPSDVADRAAHDEDFSALLVPVERIGRAMAELGADTPIAASYARVARQAGKGVQ